MGGGGGELERERERERGGRETDFERYENKSQSAVIESATLRVKT